VHIHVPQAPDHADLFLDILLDDIGRSDKAYPIDLRARAKAIEDEIVLLINEIVRSMRTQNITPRLYNILAQRMARIVNNLWQNWLNMEPTIQNCVEAELNHEQLVARTEDLVDICSTLKCDFSRKNRFLSPDKVAKMRNLLEEWQVETGDVSVWHYWMQELSKTGLELIDSWMLLIARLRTLRDETKAGGDPIVADALERVFLNIDNEKTKEGDAQSENPPVTTPVENEHLSRQPSEVTDMVFMASCTMLVLIVMELIQAVLKN
jgi:hypothetical protein